MHKQNPTLHLSFPHQLTGEQAYMSALILESMARALWLEYGDDMAGFQGRVFPDDPSSWAVADRVPPESDDESTF